jgi:hypothetical protein
MIAITALEELHFDVGTHHGSVLVVRPERGFTLYDTVLL